MNLFAFGDESNVNLFAFGDESNVNLFAFGDESKILCLRRRRSKGTKKIQIRKNFYASVFTKVIK